MQPLPSLRLALVVLSCAAWPASAETEIEVRLLTPVNSYTARPGKPVEAQLVTPLCSGAIRLIPAGATIRGEVARAHRVGLGLVHESARVDLDFREMVLPDGRTFAIDTRLIAVDSARERVDRKGSIRGIRATATMANRLSDRIAFASLGNPFVLIPAFAVTSAMFRFPDPEIAYAPGTELYLEASFPDTLGDLQPCAFPQPATYEEQAELMSLVDEVPAWSYSKRQVRPMDPVNLIYIGSADQLEEAFEAAGWSHGRENSVGAGVTAIRAIAQQGPFADAPMRTLRLDGMDPHYTFQKSLNTFAKRHHLRVWPRPADWRGQPVWASAATKDVAATFSMRPFGFTHEIENEIDSERDKVVSDLTFAGCAAWVNYVPRAGGELRTPLRKGISTDGRVAVVRLQHCQAEPRDPEGEFIHATPGPLARLLRRVLLTGRNHFLRDNIVWRAADAARFGWVALARWSKSRAQAQRTEEAANVPFLRPSPAERIVLEAPPPANPPPSGIPSAELESLLAHPFALPEPYLSPLP